MCSVLLQRETVGDFQNLSWRVRIGMAAFRCVGIAFVFGVFSPLAAHGVELLGLVDASTSGVLPSDAVGALNGSYVVARIRYSWPWMCALLAACCFTDWRRNCMGIQ